EEANIAPVLTELRQWLSANEPSAEIVFVDDGSSDGTSAEAANALSGTPHQLLRHETNRGIGAALKTGVRAAKGAWVTFLPADGQIAPAAIGTLRAAAAQERAEVVFSVYDHRDDGLHRKVLSAGVRALIWMIHGVRMQSDGPYLFRHLHFDPDQLIPDTFFLNFEFPIRVLGADIPATVVTIECRPRRSGHSKSTGLKRIYGVAQDLLELRVRRARELRASRA
ncbi:MAG: glycosyltransferase family 2 protein, partial [Deltaproteobacteria bacterium]|nr:glycosyltransferase family 2 protein [Deltaproteobacteria bacterium]